MGTLHLAPGLSAAGSLIQAFRAVGADAEVLALVDDLSCGPIQNIDAASRSEWWSSINRFDVLAVESDIHQFWGRVSRSDDRLIVWTGRHSAKELAFLLAVADGIGDRPFSIVDAAEHCGPFVRNRRSGEEIPGAISVWPSEMLAALFGTERPVGRSEHTALRERWRTLRCENATFRVAAGADLISVPETYFDEVLIAQAKLEPQTAARIVGDTLARDEAWMQVDYETLLWRLVALIGAGRLMAEGDTWDTRKCFVRLSA